MMYYIAKMALPRFMPMVMKLGIIMVNAILILWVQFVNNFRNLADNHI